MSKKSRRASKLIDSLTPVKCVFQFSKTSDDSCKACQPFILIDKIFGEWTCRICGRQEYDKKRMKKHAEDKHETLLHTCEKLKGETSKDSTATQDCNNGESKLSESEVEPMNTKSIDQTDNLFQDVIDDESKFFESKVEHMTTASTETRTELFDAIELAPHTSKSGVQDENNNESELNVELMDMESVDKNTDVEHLEVVAQVHNQGQDTKSLVQDAKHIESNLSRSKEEIKIMESVDTISDTEGFKITAVVPTLKKGSINGKAKEKWQIVEISPTKKYFRRISKPLEKVKRSKEINSETVDLVQSKNRKTTQIKHTSTNPNLDLFENDLMPKFKNLTPVSPILNLERFDRDLMQSIQRSQVNQTPISNHGQVDVNLMEAKPVQRSIRMRPTINEPLIRIPQVKFSEDVVCQEFLPKNESGNLRKRKTKSSPLRIEKRFKIKPKSWEYDASNLVNKLLDPKKTNTDENNNLAFDNND